MRLVLLENKERWRKFDCIGAFPYRPILEACDYTPPSNPFALLARRSSAQDFSCAQSRHVLLTPQPVTPPRSGSTGSRVRSAAHIKLCRR